MTAKSETAAASDRELAITRLFDAPRQLVFDAWTDPAHIARWWGPIGFTTTTHSMDVRPGGDWRFIMHGPDGRDYPSRIAYEEVVKPERIVYRHVGDDAVEPVRFHVTVTFAEENGKTRLTMRMIFPSAEALARVIKEYKADEGLTQTISRLGEFVASMAPTQQEFSVTRVFDAPRDLVFRAWTESEHLTRWFGPVGFTTLSSKNELRPGGLFHFCMRSGDGREMWGKWVYREIVRPERLVFVNSFSDAEGNTARAPFSADWPLEVLSTVTFEERDGRTTVTLRGIPVNATETERKTFENGRSSMQQGWKGTLDQLTEYLAKA